MRIVIDTESEDYEQRMRAAKERAEWELGSRGWAGRIVGAFLYPEDDARALVIEKDA